MGEAVTLHAGWCREGSQEAGIWGMNGNRLQTGSGKSRHPSSRIRLSLSTYGSLTQEKRACATLRSDRWS